MKLLVIHLSVLVGCLALTVLAKMSFKTTPCWCWSRDQGVAATATPHPVSKEYISYGSYGTEVDWNNPQRTIPLNYEQEQGKLIFYQQCVWCHSDTTPAGPSNRSNVTPLPPLMNDGATLNGQSDDSLRKIIALGGGAVGKSPMMPPYGETLTPSEIESVIAYTRVIAVPEYRARAVPSNDTRKSKGL